MAPPPSPSPSQHKMTFHILGAGVIGLTTALELSSRYPLSVISIIATHFPGDLSIKYTSPWAGANWLSVATDNGRMEGWDRVTYKKFLELSTDDEKGVPSSTEGGKGKGISEETGVKRVPIRAYYDSKIEEAGILSQGTGKVWYEEMTGLRWLDVKGEREKREGVVFGYEARSFVVDVTKYLPWLVDEIRKRGIEMQRRTVSDINELTGEEGVNAVYNCTGLGSWSLKGVEDKELYPTRGQVMLVENPKTSMERMYFRSPQRVNKDTTYVFPRNPDGGVILGGCRFDNEWDGEVDLEFAEDIKRRCCALAPELGRPEDLKVIRHAVGLRPSRKGGPRLEREMMGKTVVIHNYGAGGAGYQASWGMAKDAVDLLVPDRGSDAVGSRV